MGRVNENNWLDEALTESIHSDDTQPDFDRWKADHPEAVNKLTARAQRSPMKGNRHMNSLWIKFAAAAVVAIAGIIGVTQLTKDKATTTTAIDAVPVVTLTGPTTHTFDDGSVVKLAAGASIRTYGQAGKRGFEHLAGQIDITVAKGLGEFIVTSPYGNVKALGTQFVMDLVDGQADSGEAVQLLAVEVTEGKVEVSNAKGMQQLAATQDGIVEADSAPYDFNQDENVPTRLRERIQAMLDAFEAGDAVAWAANFNIHYVFKLVKGQVQYDPNLFGGNEEDAKRLQQAFGNVQSVEELSKVMLGGINISEPIKIYVRGVEVSQDGMHARAQCVRRKGPRSVTITTPQWHYFDNDWWQIDD